jgi:hypothetical protein
MEVLEQTVRLEEKQDNFHHQGLPLARIVHCSLFRQVILVLLVFYNNSLMEDGHEGENNAATQAHV